MTQEEERYYEIGEASYEWVGERGDTEFRLGAEWADEHPRKGLVGIEKIRNWLEHNTMSELCLDLGNFQLVREFIDNCIKAMEE